MKRIESLWLAFILLALCAGASHASGEAVPEDAPTAAFAFGLFSIYLPEGSVLAETDYDFCLGMEQRVYDNPWMVMRVNYMPVGDFDDFSMQSSISFLFADYGLEQDGYRIANIEAIAFEGGTARGQIMCGTSQTCLWMEAKTDAYGYEIGITTPTTDEAEVLLADAARSFRVDLSIEQDRAQRRQAKYPDGTFDSTDHGLSMTAGPDWDISDTILHQRPNTAFAIEKDMGERLIQMVYYEGYAANMSVKEMFDWYASLRREMLGLKEAGTPETILLENLGGVEALTVIHEADVYSQEVCFLYEGRYYCGSFMWIKDLDKTAREETAQIIQSLAPARNERTD